MPTYCTANDYYARAEELRAQAETATQEDRVRLIMFARDIDRMGKLIDDGERKPCRTI